MSLKGAEDDEGHVVALGCASRESVGSLDDAGYGVTSAEAVAGGDGLDQSLFSPFAEVGAHGFAEAVGVDHQQVAWGQRDLGLLIGTLRQQTHYCTASLIETFDGAVLSGAA